jgi:hypothetical protein
MPASTDVFPIRRVVGYAAVAIVVLMAACSNDGTPVTAANTAANTSFSQADRAQGGSWKLAIAQGLLWTARRDSSVAVTKVINGDGGTIELPAAGLQLVVPRGAVVGEMVFSVTALPGNVVAYDFQPHGAVFNVPLTLVQDLGRTNFENIKLPKGFVAEWNGAYFADARWIDEDNGFAVVAELLPATAAWTWTGGKKNGRVSFPIRHFSGYMLSMGRE